MTTRRGRVTLLAAAAAMAGGLALAGAPNASAATVSTDAHALATISASDRADHSCKPRHHGHDWYWFHDSHGHHWWRHWEYDHYRDRWHWSDHYWDNHYCKYDDDYDH